MEGVIKLMAALFVGPCVASHQTFWFGLEMARWPADRFEQQRYSPAAGQLPV